MSRYVRHEVLNQPADFVQFMMNDFLTKHGFRLENFKGQMVYRAGGGWFEMPKFLVWGYENGVFHLEAWTRYLILPGVYSKEKDLDGFYGALPKKAYKNDLEQLVALLHQPVGAQQQNMSGAQGMPQQNMNGTQGMSQQNMNGMPPQGNGPIMVQGVDTSRYANMALGFGIAGLALSWLTWIMIIIDITAIIYAEKGKNSNKKGRATAGMVCAIIGLVISGILFILNFVLGLVVS